MQAKDRIIVALDFPTSDEAAKLTQLLGDDVTTYKIGLELLFSGGLDLANILIAEGKRVFIDAKFLDIGNTVERAVANVAGNGATFLTIHGHDRKTMEAAVRGRGDSRLKLLAVTVMTNLDQNDLQEQGIEMSTQQLALHRAALARQCGFDGVIASGHEARSIRETVGDDFHIITPGIRLAGSDAGDQMRIMTPAHAIEAGADHLVIGRPITQAADPVEAARKIIGDVEQALSAASKG